MKSVEIKIDLGLDEKRLTQVELHSFHNILAVIIGELQFFGMVLGDKSALLESRSQCGDLLKVLSEPARVKSLVSDWARCKGVVLADIDRTVSGRSLKPEHQKLIEESTANISRMLEVVDIRVKELFERMEDPGSWKPYSIAAIIDGLQQVFDAMAMNSRGRYGIVYDPARQGDNDYLIRIHIQGQEDGIINLPPMLIDVLRDLTANARKYTAPGGLVESSLTEDEKGITLIVTDTGRGIPENEIEKVVRFGVRGSNVKPSETKGGGYGLTKAAHVCRKHGGRMWIESGIGAGAKVTIQIPKDR